MSAPQNARVTFYTRKGCHLCDEAKAEVERARSHIGFVVEYVDIDQDDDLRARFNDEVPVIFVNGRKAFKYRLTAEDLLRKLERSSQ